MRTNSVDKSMRAQWLAKKIAAFFSLMLRADKLL
jgi:hypothetical protein